MRILRSLFLLLMLCLAVLPAAAQQGPAPAPRPAQTLTPADIDRLTSLLADEGRRAEFLRTLEALAGMG